MLRHVVMWKLKDSAEGRSKAENVVILKDMLEALPGKIKQIKHLEVGVNIAQAPPAYDLVLIVDLADQIALQIYQEHPEHMKVADFVFKVREVRAVVDYTC